MMAVRLMTRLRGTTTDDQASTPIVHRLTVPDKSQIAVSFSSSPRPRVRIFSNDGRSLHFLPVFPQRSRTYS